MSGGSKRRDCGVCVLGKRPMTEIEIHVLAQPSLQLVHTDWAVPIDPVSSLVCNSFH